MGVFPASLSHTTCLLYMLCNLTCEYDLMIWTGDKLHPIAGIGLCPSLFVGNFSKQIQSSKNILWLSLCVLFHHSLLGSNHVIRILSQPYRLATQWGTVGSFSQPAPTCLLREWAIMAVFPPTPVKSSNNCRLSRHVDYTLLRHPKPESPNYTAPECLAHRNCVR